MLEQQTANILQMGDNARIVAMCAVVVLAYLADFLCCKLLVPLIRRVARRTAFKWDNYLAEGKSLNYVFHLIPPLVFLVVIPLLFPDPAPWKRLLLRGIYIYFIIIACRLVCEFISSIYVISSETEALRNKPLKGLYQMFKVLVVCIGAILVIGVLVDKDFTALIAGLGASAAVLMLIFKDTILGVVAGVQLSAYDMLRPGDWIVMEKYGVNGEVEEVNMNTVKVRNWDKTITTIPPYLLVSDSFTNWRGMRESGGRRVARSLRIDMNSVRFCTPAELEHFAKADWARGHGAGARDSKPPAVQSLRRALPEKSRQREQRADPARQAAGADLRRPSAAAVLLHPAEGLADPRAGRLGSHGAHDSLAARIRAEGVPEAVRFRPERTESGRLTGTNFFSIFVIIWQKTTSGYSVSRQIPRRWTAWLLRSALTKSSPSCL